MTLRGAAVAGESLATAARSSLRSPWTAGAVLIALVLATPTLAVLASLAHPRVDVWRHLWATQLVELVVNTVLLVAGVGAGTLVLGTALAWLVEGFEFPGRRVLEWALMLPLAVPAYVIGFAFLGLLDYAGPVQTFLRLRFGGGAWLPELRSYGGVLLVMTLVLYPYVYLLARVAFREQGAAVLETARSLGRSRSSAFLQVMLPMARPSLVAGVALAMMEALADFGTVAIFGYRTLTEAIYRVWLGMFDRAAATQLATLLLLAAFLLLAFERGLRGRASFVQSERRGAGIVRFRLRGWRAGAAAAGASFVLAAAFVLPVGQLLVWAGGLPAAGRVALLAAPLTSSVVIAGVTAALTVTLALVLAYAGRLHPATPVRWSARFASMGYALPGSVVAVGVLTPIALLDHVLAGLAEGVLGRPVGLLLTGSLAALVFAYVVRFVAISFQAVDASLARISSSLDEAARSLGVGAGGVLRRIHLPLMRGGLFTALILVFVDTMKEMPATLLLRPFGFDTLAVSVWQKTSESLWDEAAVPALAIVAAGLLPVLVAIRLGARPRRVAPPPGRSVSGRSRRGQR